MDIVNREMIKIKNISISYLRQRENDKKIGMLMAISCGSILLFFTIILAQQKLNNEQQDDIFVLCMFLGYFGMLTGIGIYQAGKTKKKYKKKYRNILAIRQIESMFENVIYKPGHGLSKKYLVFMDLVVFSKLKQLLSPLKNFSSCNYIKAYYKKQLFIYSDVHVFLHLYGRPHRVDIFYGHILILDYPIYSPRKLRIYSYDFYHVKWADIPKLSGAIRLTGIKDFDKKFQVQCDDEKQFKNTLTPEMIRKLEVLYSLYKDVSVQFYNNKLYIAVKTGHEAFEPDYEKMINYEEEIAKIRRDIKVITDTFDIFYSDLKEKGE